jgi:hypothetical protein
MSHRLGEGKCDLLAALACGGALTSCPHRFDQASQADIDEASDSS